MSPRHYFAIGALAGVTIFCEIALTRLFSVVQYYHGAFLAISLALFGFAVSGVFVMLRPARLGRVSGGDQDGHQQQPAHGSTSVAGSACAAVNAPFTKV